MKMFHVYEDWTTELEPRCFYVGKGDDSRVAKLKRFNEHHLNVVSSLGQKRVVVFSTIDEKATFELERKLIKERHTYLKDPEFNGIGCNRTLGGQGPAGRTMSEETKKKLSIAKSGVPSNKVW